MSLVAMLDAPALAPGGRVEVTAVVTNHGSAPLHYPGGRGDACRYRGDFWFDFPASGLDVGQEWQGDRGKLKGMLFDTYPESLPLGRMAGIGCDAAGLPEVLAPGASLDMSASWDGRYGDGYPASPGRYDLNVRFAILRPPDDDFAPLTTVLPVAVLAAPRPTPPGRAVDLALADGALANWLARHPIAAWTAGPRLTYRPDTSDFQLILDGGAGARLEVTIADDGRGAVTVVESTDPTFETEPPSSPRP